MSATVGYPVASATSLGMVEVGAGLAIAAGGVLSAKGAGLAQAAHLGADTVITPAGSTDLLSLTLGAGTWLLLAVVNWSGTATTDSLGIVIWDGGTTLIGGSNSPPVFAAGNGAALFACGVVTLATPATIKLTASAAGTGTTTALKNNSLTAPAIAPATWLIALPLV